MERYEVVGTFDSRMCDDCGDMNGMVFPMKDFREGTTAPPFHPWCRCTTAPYFEDMKDIGNRWMRDPETGKGGTVPSDMTYQEWKAKYVDNSGERGIIITRDVKPVTINSIEQPIEQRQTGKGNPNAILTFGIELNNRQKELLSHLPEYDSRISIAKSSVNMSDLSALTAYTGDEYAMFTKGNERIIVRGNHSSVNITVDEARRLAKEGFKWSGHTHPGTDFLCMQPSDGDYSILEVFSQSNAVVYNSKGDFRTFEKR